MKKGNIKSLIIASLLSTAPTYQSESINMNYQNKISPELKNQIINNKKIPKKSKLEYITWDTASILSNQIKPFSKQYFPSNKCSGYVRIVAKEQYKKNYSWQNAWDRIYSDSIILNIENFKTKPIQESYKELKKGIKKGIVKPGDILGIYFTKSYWANKNDQKNNPIQLTHNLIFQGTTLKDGKIVAIFDHLWGSQESRENLIFDKGKIYWEGEILEKRPLEELIPSKVFTNKN